MAVEVIKKVWAMKQIVLCRDISQRCTSETRGLLSEENNLY